MKYKENKHWKYTALEGSSITLPRPFATVFFDHEYFSIRASILTVKEGYSIDGFTAFFDIKSEMQAAFYHDAVLQAMDLDLIDVELTNDAHRVFRDAFKRKWLGKLLYLGIRAFYPIRQLRRRVFK